MIGKEREREREREELYPYFELGMEQMIQT
jgi:hypothetical protein